MSSIRNFVKTKFFLHFTPRRFWMLLFGVWFFLLTGVSARFTGSPGIWQALELEMLLRDKKIDLKKTEEEIVLLKVQRDALKSNPEVQQREIRKVLGFVAPDELVFDFTGEDTQSKR